MKLSASIVIDPGPRANYAVPVQFPAVCGRLYGDAISAGHVGPEGGGGR